MNVLGLVAVGWLLAGVGTAGASAVWYTAQRPDRLDRIDAVFLTFVALVVVAVWPVVALSVAVGVLLRRLQSVSLEAID